MFVHILLSELAPVAFLTPSLPPIESFVSVESEMNHQLSGQQAQQQVALQPRAGLETFNKRPKWGNW